jgi:4-hydroxythreonine-4-phosphate dehydrogenase
MGDPAGVGPEIIVKAWQSLRLTGPAFMVVGDHDSLAAASKSGASILKRVSRPDEVRGAFGTALPVLDMPLQREVVSGKPSAAHAPAVIRWIETAVGLALSGAVSGLVTGPIAKAPLYQAGFPFPGHTEFIADLTAGATYDGVRGPVMMLAAPGLRTTLVTIHEPLAKVPSLLGIDLIVRTGRITAEALRNWFGIEAPRLAMAGLNPHAGEGGAMGWEEAEVIAPACAALNHFGIDCSGPRPADTLFHREARETYDAAVCMYHDQALIPVKMLDFWGGVNLTLGLPIVRTSPDHGVGYDIAGRGLARADSLIAAIRMAGEIAARRAKRG